MNWLTENLGPLPGWAWIAIGGGVIVLIIIVIIIVIVKKSKKKTSDVVHEVIWPDFEGQYITEQGSKLIIAGANAWMVDSNGKTELVKAVDDKAPSVAGDKIYYINSDVITRVVKVGDDYERLESKQSNYITISFLTKAQAKIGDTIYSR